MIKVGLCLIGLQAYRPIFMQARSSNWLERWSPKPDAVGSNPTGPAILVLLPAGQTSCFPSLGLCVSVVERCENAMFKKLAKFLREVKVELKKVSWPSRAEISGSTGVVIVTVIIVAIYLGILDNILQQIMMLIH